MVENPEPGLIPSVVIEPSTAQQDDDTASQIETTASALPHKFQGFHDAVEIPDVDETSSGDEQSDCEFDGFERFFGSDNNNPSNNANSNEIPDDTADIQSTKNRKYEDLICRYLNIDSINNESVHKFEGWLGKDVLVQGKIFLTQKYFLFYAELPPSSRDTILASPLAKRVSSVIPVVGQASYNRYWFSLKGGAFSWYRSAADIYFPQGLIPLSTISSVETVKQTPEKFIVTTRDQRTFTFKADSRNAAYQWSKELKKEVFKVRNKNSDPTVIVRIPLQNIVTAQDSSVLDIGRILKIIAVPDIKKKASKISRLTDVAASYYSFMFFGRGRESFLLSDSISNYTDDFKSQQNVQLILENNSAAVDYENSIFGQTVEAIYDTTPDAELEFQESDVFDFETQVETNKNSETVPVGEESKLEGVKSSDTEKKINDKLGESRIASSVKSTDRHLGHHHHHFHTHLNPFHSRHISKLAKKLHIGSDNSKDISESNAQNADSKLLSIFNDTSTNATVGEHDYSSSADEGSDSDDGTINNEPEGVKVSRYRKFLDYQGIFSSSYSLALKPLTSRPGRSNSRSGNRSPRSYSPNKAGSPPKNFLLMRSNSRSSSKAPSLMSNALADQSKADANAITDDNEEINNWFRKSFGLDKDTKLFAEYVCSVSDPNQGSSWFSDTPSASGRLFVSNRYLCFKQNNARLSRSRMVIPVKDITHITASDSKSPTYSVTLEVAETAYNKFMFTFDDIALVRDVKEALKCVLKYCKNENGWNRRGSVDVESELRYLDYTLRTARLATYEPQLTTRLKHQIPPLIFDPKSLQFREAFMQKPMKKLKFAMLMIGSRGDVQPYIALSQGLIAEGHDCIILSHKEFRPWVEEFGIEFKEIAGDPSELMELMISHGSISYGFVKEALAHFKGWIKDLMITSWKAMKDSNADVLIESPSAMIGIHIAEALNVPYFRAFTMPWTRTKAYPQALVSGDQNRSGSYNNFTYNMYDRLVWFCISKYVNKWRQKHLKLPATSLDVLSQEDIPFLYCVSPSVLSPPLDQFDWVHTCGYWNLRDTKSDKEKEESIDKKVREFMVKARKLNKKLVYIGFGSIIVSDPSAMTKTVIEATKKADVYCILARGWSSRKAAQKSGDKDDKDSEKVEKDEDKAIKEDHIIEVDSINHQWLFKRVDVCVHHGGSGTTGASLTAGKPTIVKPFFGDQFFYASRVESLNVGVHLKTLNTERLVDALKTCTTSKQLIRQAAVLGEQIRNEHGVEDAILSIYQELDYAKDVTIRRRRQTLEYAESGIFPDPKSFLQIPGLPKLGGSGGSNSDSWFSLPKLGTREQHRFNVNKHRELDVSL